MGRRFLVEQTDRSVDLFPAVFYKVKLDDKIPKFGVKLNRVDQTMMMAKISVKKEICPLIAELFLKMNLENFLVKIAIFL